MNSCVRNYQCFLPEIKHPPVKENVLCGGTGGDRTHDRWLKRPLLYRLSYSPDDDVHSQGYAVFGLAPNESFRNKVPVL